MNREKKWFFLSLSLVLLSDVNIHIMHITIFARRWKMWVQLKSEVAVGWCGEKWATEKTTQSIWFESLAGKSDGTFPFRILKTLRNINISHFEVHFIVYVISYQKFCLFDFKWNCVFFGRCIQFVFWLLFCFKHSTHNNKTSTSCPTAHNSFEKKLCYCISCLVFWYSMLLTLYERKKNITEKRM